MRTIYLETSVKPAWTAVLQHAHLHSNNLHNLLQSGVQDICSMVTSDKCAADTESRVVVVIILRVW